MTHLIKPGFHIYSLCVSFDGLMGRWGPLALLSLSYSFTIAEIFQGNWESFLLFPLRVFQGRSNRTCFYLSDSVFVGLYGSLTVFADLSAVFPFGLSQNCATLSDPQRPYRNQALAKNDCAPSLWLVKTVSKEVCVIQIWFSHVPWTDESANADKENMIKNIQPFHDFADRCF